MASPVSSRSILTSTQVELRSILTLDQIPGLESDRAVCKTAPVDPYRQESESRVALPITVFPNGPLEIVLSDICDPYPSPIVRTSGRTPEPEESRGQIMRLDTHHINKIISRYT